MDTTFFVLKVFLLSLIVSIAIKYFAPFLSIAPTDANALIAIISPTLIMAIVLLVRRNVSSHNSLQ